MNLERADCKSAVEQSVTPRYRFRLRPSVSCMASMILIAAILTCLHVLAQAPDVPLSKQGRFEAEAESKLSAATHELFDTTNVIKLDAVNAQLKRGYCQLDLLPPRTNRLTSRQLYTVARHSHLRVGWAYVGDKDDEWHVNLAGGYVLSTNGAVATCYHVVQPAHEIKAGCLVAVDEEDKLFPVTEILAANRYSDACIVRVAGDGLHPLPLNTNVYPGDPAYCYSDPLDHRGYFSSGIINRFYQFPGRRPFSAPAAAAFSPTRINISTDWAPGSSGSAVLDECGNAIGHVSTIATVSEQEDSEAGVLRFPGPTMIVFHEAVAARDVLLLIRR